MNMYTPACRMEARYGVGEERPPKQAGPGDLTLLRSDVVPHCRTWLEVVCTFDDQYTVYNQSRANQECAYLAHGTTIIVV